jgi:hypothetical protein
MLVTSEVLHVTLKLVKTCAETVFFKTMNNVTSVVVSELNPTMEPSPTNAERDVSYPTVVMELKISVNTAILEQAMV